MEEFLTNSAKETEGLGEKLAHNFRIGDIIILTGGLGAGKTTFVQGVAKAFSVKSRIISPTFILVRKHRGKFDKRKLNLYHIDLYRLKGTEIKNLGLEEIFEDPNGIFLIEWGEKQAALKASWEINFEILGKDKRRITVRNYNYTPGV